jgi:hypothetical protein
MVSTGKWLKQPKLTPASVLVMAAVMDGSD